MAHPVKIESKLVQIVLTLLLLDGFNLVIFILVAQRFFLDEMYLAFQAMDWH